MGCSARTYRGSRWPRSSCAAACRSCSAKTGDGSRCCRASIRSFGRRGGSSGRGARTPRTRWRRLPDSVRDLRRGQILTAARRLVAEHGLEALTIGALEDRLAFTRGVITYHFANKDEIVRAVFASAIDEIDASVRREVEGGA